MLLRAHSDRCLTDFLTRPNILIMKSMALNTVLCPALLMIAAAVHAQVTAVNSEYHEWNTAAWSNGTPISGGTAFLNGNSFVEISQDPAAVAQGIRVGNTTAEFSTLSVTGSSLRALYIVVGDAADSNAIFKQSGGSLSIENTANLDFEIGNPFNSASMPCSSNVTFTGGTAKLADVRFNLRANRATQFVVDGSRAEIHCDRVSAATAAETSWKNGDLEFRFDAAGIATLKVSGELALGAKNQIDLNIDGAAYMGRDIRFVLIDAGTISGSFANIKITGFSGGASVSLVDNDIVLTIP
jgi:hypothetical protein